jgi:pimeloyl-ACP methyl ester carboxylesterase
MLYIAVFLVLLMIIITYVLFISRSQTLGKFLFNKAMAAEQKQAELCKSTIDIDGTSVCYYSNERVSERPTLLLLHGFSADKSIWHRFAKLAKDDFNLVIPDLLGHGETPYSKTQSHTLHAQTKMLMQLMSALKVEQYCVAGNSMGGMIAMQLLLSDNDRLEKAILLDPAGAKSDFALGMHEAGTNPFLLRTFPEFYALYGRTMAKSPFVPPSVLRYVGEREYLGRYDQLSHMFEDFFNIDDFYDAPMPIEAGRLHIIWGEKDDLLPVSDAQMWVSMTDASLSIYPQIGHMPMVECPTKTYNECRSFLTSSE